MGVEKFSEVNQDVNQENNGGGVEEQKPQGESRHLAKNVSLFAQIFATAWTIGWCFFLFTTSPNNFGVLDVIISGVAIAGYFMPVYFSIIVDKFVSNFSKK